MAWLLDRAQAAACVGAEEKLLWIAMMDGEARKTMERQCSGVYWAWELAEAEGCGMVVWNRTAEIELLPAKAARIGKGNHLWLCSDPELQRYVKRLDAEGTKFYFHQGEEPDAHVRIYHGVVDLCDYSEEQINRMLRSSTGYACKKDLAVGEQISLELAQQATAEAVWETEMRHFDYWDFSNTVCAAAFLRWWTSPVMNHDAEIVKVIPDAFVLKDPETSRYFVTDGTGLVLASNNGEYYDTVNDAEAAWEKVQTGNWTCADPDCYQYLRVIRPGKWDCIEIRGPYPNGQFEVVRETVCLENYTDEEKLSYIKGYGYDSFDELKETYSTAAEQVMVECIFECLDLEPCFSGSEKDCIAYVEGVVC